MATRISDMAELTASINNSSNVFSFVDNTESYYANQNKKITFDNFLKLFIENFDANPANDLVASSNSQIFPASDTSTTTKVKVYRNLSISSSVTVTPNASCYGIIFICTGDFTNYGTISMTGKGLYGPPSGYPYTTINSLYTGWLLPLDNPVAKKANNFRFAKEGSIWTNLISPPNKYSSLPIFGTCGSGGYGGGNTYKPGGGGAAGTMFGAGGGGGGAGYGFSPSPSTPKGNTGGPGVGIAGGYGGPAGPIYSGDEGGGGGGAGSPAGSGGSSGPLTAPYAQSSGGGTGGAGSMCFIVKGNFYNFGTIISVGGNGGGGGGYQGGGGGGSGGGSITIIYGGAYYGGTLSYSGGYGGPNAPSAAAGANGSSGTFSATNINFI